MKAIAVIDIPDVSNIDDMFLTGNVHISYKTNDISGGLIQGLDKVPLKPLPDRQKVKAGAGGYTRGFTAGFNKFRYLIAGDKDESNISD